MNASGVDALGRFLATFDIVVREGRHLHYSWSHLFSETIDADWVADLDDAPELAERLEAFISRFGRMQDTMGGKLLPRWLVALAEEPGSLIETLNRAERLGVLESAESWLEARQLRNRLVHEYMERPDAFAEDLGLARSHTVMLFATFNRLRDYAVVRMQLAPETALESLPDLTSV